MDKLQWSETSQSLCKARRCCRAHLLPTARSFRACSETVQDRTSRWFQRMQATFSLSLITEAVRFSGCTLRSDVGMLQPRRRGWSVLSSQPAQSSDRGLRPTTYVYARNVERERVEQGHDKSHAACHVWYASVACTCIKRVQEP